ncbi:MAG: sugar ABC transporter ATP-binding protein [Phycisphaeraceae bacterium]|nr:MAG: sugar ABC transporter ATP-binding protein [Phycisphaeraceae bacterium]
MSESSTHPPLLLVRGVSKSFPGVRALDNVELTLRRGEVHALMGENGAGKSTLIKVLTGVYPHDGGTIEFDGRAISPASPRDAERAGISTVYQEVNLVPTLSVAENLCVGRFPTRGGLIRWGAARRRAETALERVGLKLRVGRQLDEYSLAIQQMVAIARALDAEAKLLILDEPTSSLDESEVDRLLELMDSLRSGGLAILFVTHFMGQVYRISDRITVLRNGAFVAESMAKDLPRFDLIGQMVGKDPEALRAREAEVRALHQKKAGGGTLARVNGLGKQGSVAPVGFEIGEGQTVGLGGLLGSGRTETARLIFGIDKADAGSLEIDGKAHRPGSPREAMALGIAMTPDDRKVNGIIPNLSVRDNIVLALQSKRGIWRRISPKAQRDLAAKYIASLNIKTSNAETPVGTLSGGNQQKVLLARWLAVNPRLFILDEPTRGIDVGAKGEIEHLVADLAEQGMSLVFISSELEEVARVSQRVVVLCDREQVGELEGEAISEHAILEMIARAGEKEEEGETGWKPVPLGDEERNERDGDG